MKVQRALAVALFMFVLGTSAAMAEGTHTNCEDYAEAPVGIFAGTACSPLEAWWPIFTSWGKSLEGEAINDSISSIFVKEGWSVLAAENSDGSGRTACLAESKWELHGDTWSDGTGSMGDSISYVEVFEDADCGAEELPVEEPKTYCDSLVFDGVGLFDLTACEQPGPARTAPISGTINLADMSGLASSLYIATGWSMLISDGQQEACISETKWELGGDLWLDGTSQNNSIISAVAFNDSTCGDLEVPDEKPKAYCDAVSLTGVVMFDKVACETPGDSVTSAAPGTLDLGSMSARASAVYISQGWSVLVFNAEGQEACLFETKWDLSTDLWPNGSSQGDSIVSAEVFADSNCGYDELPTPEEPVVTYCDSLSSEGVSFFDQAACQMPGESVKTLVPGVMDFSSVNWRASSVYIAPGWSVLASNGNEQFCLIGTKWNLANDKWASGLSQDNSISSAVIFNNSTCQSGTPPIDEPESPEPASYCNDNTFSGIGLYDLKSCETPGSNIVVTTTGSINLGDLSGLVSSVYIAQGWSVLVGNGTEQACLSASSKWDLSLDRWPSGTAQDNTIVSAEAFSNTSCTAQGGGGTPPPSEEKPSLLYLPAIEGPEPKAFCDGRTLNGAGLYAKKACETPGDAVEATKAGSLHPTFSPLSIFVKSGWSVHITDGGNLSTCVTETKWDLSADTWPESAQKMTNVRSAIVYDNPECDD